MAKSPPERSVLVVHGKNEKARKAMFEFLRAIDLRPIEWSVARAKTGQGSPYIGAILSAAFEMARAVVVLFTPDDEARLRPEWRSRDDGPHEATLMGQARPNVLFEAGMAMGRNEKNTVLVELGDLRPFSDIGGRHVVRLDDSHQRRQDLALRLRDAGCPVSLDGHDWHNAGDFQAAIASSNFREPGSVERESHQPETPGSPSALSDGAVEMLLRADADTSKRITVGPAKIGSPAIIAGSYPFDLSRPRAGAESRAAHKELVAMDMIEETSKQIDRTHYGITTRGFRWLEEHGKSKIVSVLAPAISSDGRDLLRATVGADGRIIHKWISSNLYFEVGGRAFPTGDTQSLVKWENALNELKRLEFVEEERDDVFSVTPKGCHFADKLED